MPLYLLVNVAKQCRTIVQSAERDLGPLPKSSYLDLCADNIPDVPLRDLEAALVIAGVGY